MKIFVYLLLIQVSAFQVIGQSLPFVNHTEIGPLLGRTDMEDKRINFSFQTFNGVRLHPNHEIGFLMGLDTYPGFNLIPLALGWRGIQKSGRRNSLYISLDVGYGSTWLEKRIQVNQVESWYQGGLMMSPALGFRKRSKNNTYSYSWSLGFKKQNASFFEGIRAQEIIRTPEDPQLPPGFQSVWEERYIMNSLYLKFGIVF